MFLIRKRLRTRRHSRTPDVSLVEASPVPLAWIRCISTLIIKLRYIPWGSERLHPVYPVVEALVSSPV